MPAGSFTLYNSFGEKLGQKLIDLSSGNFYMTLHASGYTPNVSTDDDYADLTNELSTAYGYTAGGLLLSEAWSRSGNVSKFTLASPATWNISGGDIVAKTAVVYCALATADNPLVGYFLLSSGGANVTIKSGATFTVTPSASGLFTVTT